MNLPPPLLPTFLLPSFLLSPFPSSNLPPPIFPPSPFPSSPSLLPIFPFFPSSNLLCLVNLIQKVGNFIFAQKKVIVPFPLLLFCLE